MNSTYEISRSISFITKSPLSRALGLPVSVVRDLPPVEEDPRERLMFHLKAGDYFALLNTVLGFCEEEALKTGAASEPLLRGLKLLRQDLNYLDANYVIIPKHRK